MDFKDRVVIITGGGSGIGQCIAHTYAEEGAQVVIAEKDEELGRRTAVEIFKRGCRATFIHTDVRLPLSIEEMVSQTVRSYGRLDILINNAGKAISHSPYELTVEEWDDVLQTNLRGAFLCAREVAKSMRNRGGTIVNIASTRASMSEPNWEAYAASKGGLVALTHALAASFAKDRIRVNCISPGWIETADYEQLRAEDHEQHFSQRVGRPEDIAQACLYLTRSDSDFINGTNLVIDGGMTRKMMYTP